MVDEYGFYEAPEDYEPPSVPDAYFLGAQEEIRALYENDKESVYYIRQLQVKLEKRYFHWVTNNAMIGLLRIGYLKDLRIDREKGTSTRYFIHRSNRWPKRRVNKLVQVIKEYSEDRITRSCGHRAEDLFCKALALRGFMPAASKVRGYNGKMWVKTNHDLDFVFNKDGVGYGCEIKNTLGYIDKDELEVKLEMCSFFGVRPLFIMRYSPKTYNKLIVERIKNVAGLPVICSKAIPDGIIDRFEKWHVKNK
jgi:hypothetical protein